MTKSRTLRRAGAVVLSLAMAATTVFAGGVDSKAASKVKLSSTSKTFAAKGGTATVKIKGATSAKISSTTVKSSKTSVATVKKSSKVKFKVTAKKNTATKKKTATITAKVKIAKKYQKKYTKKSYTLKYKVTVKAAATPTEAPVEELALESVEAETDIQLGGAAKYLRVYFSKSLKSLDFSECEVRRVSDNQLLAIESVTLAADGKSARVAMVGNEGAGMGVSTAFLDPLVEYNFIVKQGDKTAEKKFTIPVSLPDSVVTGINKADKKIKLNSDTEWYSLASDSLVADFEELLGQTIKGKLSANNTISELSVTTNSVVYAAVTAEAKGTAATAGYKDAKTGTVYRFNDGNIGGTATKDYYSIATAADGWDAASVEDATTTPVGAAYAKLSLNDAGKITSVVKIAAFTKPYGSLVSSVTADSFVAGKVETKLTGVTILKNGKTADISAIAAGDVVYIDNASKKIAVVYTDKVEGTITKSFDGEFEIGEKTVSYEYTPAAPGPEASGARYYDESKDEQLVNNAYTAGLKKAALPATAYLGLDGKVDWVVGTKTEEDTQNINLVLTTNATAEVNSLDATQGRFMVKGLNASTGKVETYTVTAATIKTIQGTAVATGKTAEIKQQGATTAESLDLTDGVTKLDLVNVNSGTDAVTITGALVKLTATKDATPVITGIAVDDSGSSTVDKINGKAYGTGSNQTNKITSGLTSIKVASGTYTTSSSTKLYVLSDDGSKDYAGLLSAYSNEITLAAAANAVVYADSTGAKVDSVVVSEAAANISSTNPDNADPITGIVTKISTSTEDGDNLLTILDTAGTEHTYTGFKTFSELASVAEGKIVKIVPAKTDAAYANSVGSSDFAAVSLGSNKFYYYSSAAGKFALSDNDNPNESQLATIVTGADKVASENLVIFKKVDGAWTVVATPTLSSIADKTELQALYVTADGAKTAEIIVY